MRNLIAVDMRRIFSSWKFYLAILIVLVSGIVTLNKNIGLFFPDIDRIGFYNLFIYSNLVQNAFTSVLAPLIAVIAFSDSILDDRKMGYIKNIAPRSSLNKYVKSRMISNSLAGGLVFVIPFVFLFITYYFIDPTTDFYSEYISGLFINVYMQSRFAYCMIFILHSFLFGAIYSLFGMGLSMIFENKYIALLLPLFYYYGTTYIANLFEFSKTSIASYFVPLLTFEFSTVIVPETANACQILEVLIIALLLIFLRLKKWRKCIN